MSTRLRGVAQENEAIVAAGRYRSPDGREVTFAVHEYHRSHRSAFYTDRVIHAPGVPVFRDERGRLLEVPYALGFLTSPAPNAGVIVRTQPHQTERIRPALDARSERVLEVAVAHGYRRLVLGAWGCGVFRNEPADVAGAFAAHLTAGGRFAGRFERVVFAVLDRRPGSPIRAAFAEVFGDVAGARQRRQ